MTFPFTSREVEAARVLRTALDMLGYTLVTHGETLDDLAPMLARAERQPQHIAVELRLPTGELLVVRFAYSTLALAAINGAMTTTDTIVDVITGSIRGLLLGPGLPTGGAA